MRWIFYSITLFFSFSLIGQTKSNKLKFLDNLKVDSVIIYKIVSGKCDQSKHKQLILNDTISNCFISNKVFSKKEAIEIKNLLITKNTYGGDYAITFQTNYAFLFFYKSNIVGSIELSTDAKRVSSSNLKIKAINKHKSKYKMNMVGLHNIALAALAAYCK